MFVFLVACDMGDLLLTRDGDRGQEFMAPRFTSAFTSVAMGCQNVISQTSSLKQNTTFVTGNLQKIGQVLERGAASAADRKAGSQLVMGWMSYVAGGIVGAALAQWVGIFSLCPVALLQVAALYCLRLL